MRQIKNLKQLSTHKDIVKFILKKLMKMIKIRYFVYDIHSIVETREWRLQNGKILSLRKCNKMDNHASVVKRGTYSKIQSIAYGLWRTSVVKNYLI